MKRTSPGVVVFEGSLLGLLSPLLGWFIGQAYRLPKMPRGLGRCGRFEHSLPFVETRKTQCAGLASNGTALFGDSCARSNGDRAGALIRTIEIPQTDMIELGKPAGDDMTPRSWARLKTLFNEAIERPLQLRTAFVAEACRGDLELSGRLYSLLRADESISPISEMIWSKIERCAMLAPPRAAASGDLILDRFEIVRWVGSGGMGDVYEARDRELQQTVALKMIRPEIAEKESILEQFKKEVLLARRLSGPNICRIHELFLPKYNGCPGDGAFLTMEYLDGITLADRLKGGPLPWPEARAIAMDICSGLAAMHKADVIHRDLKSCNIMLVDRDGAQRAVLMDFGLAHQMSGSGPTAETVLTIPGSVQGTPEYMAPEQFEGRAVNAASDLYAMGIILYELATGKHPFSSTNPIKMAILRGKRVAPASSVRRDVPRRWDVAIKRCLQYDSLQRYQSADQLIRALNGRALGIRALKNQWPGVVLAFALSAFIAVCTCFIPALRKRVEGVHLTNRENYVAVLPFDFAETNREASIISDGLMDSLAGRLSNLSPENNTFWVVPPSEIRRRRVHDPGTALRECAAAMVIQGHLSRDGSEMRLNLELIDSRRMREIGYAEIETHEQDLSALQNEAVNRLSSLMGKQHGSDHANQYH